MFSEPLEQPLAVAEEPQPEKILIVDDDESIVEVHNSQLSPLIAWLESCERLIAEEEHNECMGVGG